MQLTKTQTIILSIMTVLCLLYAMHGDHEALNAGLIH